MVNDDESSRVHYTVLRTLFRELFSLVRVIS